MRGITLWSRLAVPSLGECLLSFEPRFTLYNQRHQSHLPARPLKELGSSKGPSSFDSLLIRALTTSYFFFASASALASSSCSFKLASRSICFDEYTHAEGIALAYSSQLPHSKPSLSTPRL